MYDEKKTKKVVIIAIISILLVIAAGAAAIIFVIQMGNEGEDDHIALAEDYMDEEEYEDAISEYLLALDYDYLNVDAYLGAADAYVALEDYDAAIEILEEGLLYLEDEGDEDDVEALTERLEELQAVDPPKDSLALARQYLREKKYYDAITEFKNVLAEDPMCVEAYEGIADAYMAVDGLGAAEAILKEGLSVIEDQDDRDRLTKKLEEITEIEGPEVDREQILLDYYNSVTNGSNVYQFGQVYEDSCYYFSGRSDLELPGSACVRNGIDGYVTNMFYDFDLDGEEELVIVKYNRSETFTIEVRDVENGYATEIFKYSEIVGNLGAGDTSSERPGDIVTIEIGLCEKNGKVYITERSTYTCMVFGNYFRNEMNIYEVNGSTADHVFCDYVGGANEKAMYNNSVMMDVFNSLPGKLSQYGFDKTGEYLTTDMRFSASENITPLVYATSRHSGTYQSFNAKAAKNGGDAGVRAYVFAQTEQEGENAMNSAH